MMVQLLQCNMGSCSIMGSGFMLTHVVSLLIVQLHQFSIKMICDCKVQIPLCVHVCAYVCVHNAQGVITTYAGQRCEAEEVGTAF